jgi:hypothetical protein
MKNTHLIALLALPGPGDFLPPRLPTRRVPLGKNSMNKTHCKWFVSANAGGDVARSILTDKRGFKLINL